MTLADITHFDLSRNCPTTTTTIGRQNRLVAICQFLAHVKYVPDRQKFILFMLTLYIHTSFIQCMHYLPPQVTTCLLSFSTSLPNFPTLGKPTFSLKPALQGSLCTALISAILRMVFVDETSVQHPCMICSHCLRNLICLWRSICLQTCTVQQPTCIVVVVVVVVVAAAAVVVFIKM